MDCVFINYLSMLWEFGPITNYIGQLDPMGVVFSGNTRPSKNRRRGRMGLVVSWMVVELAASHGLALPHCLLGTRLQNRGRDLVPQREQRSI